MYLAPKLSNNMFEKEKNRKKEKKEMTVTDDHEGTQMKRFSTTTTPK